MASPHGQEVGYKFLSCAVNKMKMIESMHKQDLTDNITSPHGLFGGQTYFKSTQTCTVLIYNHMKN